MELIPSNHPPPKRANLESEVDRISTLPDEVLTHILSFLSTKMAFRTSLLSARWESLWTFVPNLDFRPSDDKVWHLEKYQDARYMNFIEDVLLSHKTSINKFHLNFATKFDISRVTAWIRAAVKHNVQDIDIYGLVNSDDNLLLLPRNLCTCKTLVRLKIGHHLQLDVPSSIHLPCLKFLDISVHSPRANLTQKFFCSSPVLEESTIYVTGDSGDMIYNVASPVLKKLVMSIRTLDIENSDGVVVIDAPVLESFEVSNDLIMRYSFKDSSTLLKARISFERLGPRGLRALGQRRNAERLFTLVKSVSAVKVLSINTRFLEHAFNMAIERKWEVIPNVTHLALGPDCGFVSARLSLWPDFVNLMHLRAVIPGDSRRYLKLLGLMPNLVSLVILVEGECVWKVNFDGQVVPSCFQTCLKKIEVLVRDGSHSELIRYFLANAKVLKNLTLAGRLFDVGDTDPLKGESFESQILSMQRCSKDCKISIRWKGGNR